MHTWLELDHNTQTWHDNEKIDGIANREDIIRAYGRFKGIEVEEQKPVDMGNIIIKMRNTDKLNQMSIFGIGAMFHSMRDSLRQCEEYSAMNMIEYDYVLFIRPDICIRKPFKISELLDGFSKQEIAEGFFTLANPIPKITAGFMDMGGVDICFFAVPKTMSEIIKNTESVVKNLISDMQIDHCPEYDFIKLAEKCGYVPYRIERFDIEKDWDILRYTKKIKLRRRIIRKCISRNLFGVWLFPTMMRCIARMQFDLFGFKIDFSIGNPSLESR